MNKLLLTAIASGLLFLASCKQEYFGSYNVLYKMNLVTTKGENIVFNAGEYYTTVKIASKNKIELVLKTTLGERKFAFKTNQNLKKITNGSQITLPAKENGQPYHLKANYNVSYSDTNKTRDVENCTYYTTEYRCEDVYHPRKCEQVRECNGSSCATRETCSDAGYARECGNKEIPHNGRQDVEYYHRTTTDRVLGQILHPANNTVAANINVSDSNTRKIYTYQSTCR